MSISEEKKERLLYLDGWRGLAIATVLIGHFVPGAAVAGAFGVELFFVLSGRLMAEILFVRKMPLGLFFIRRASRIYPALIVFVLTLWCLSAVMTDLGVGSGDAFAALFMIMNYAQIFGWVEGHSLAHLWSVSIEEHSYIVLAAMALWLARDEAKVMRTCLVLSIIAMANGALLSLAGGGGVHDIYWRTDVRLAPVFMSAAFYLYFRKRAPLPGFVPIACCLSSIATYFLSSVVIVQYTLSTLLLALAVSTLDSAPKAVLALLARPALSLLGTLSFSLYLWQQPFYIHLGGSLLSLMLATAAAGASYYIVEQPARRAINNFAKRASAPSFLRPFTRSNRPVPEA